MVIIASILIAFGIQAWWEERQEDAEATRILEAILREHIRNIEEIDTWEQSAILLDETIKQIAKASKPESDLSNEKFDELMSRVTFYGGPSLNFGSLENVVSGGRLAVIDDLDLRDAMARWFGFQERYRTVRDSELAYLDNQFIPYLIKSGAYLQIIKQDNSRDFDIGVLRSIPLRETVDHRKLSVDAEFLGQLAWRYLYRQDYRWVNRTFMEFAPSFKRRLENALGISSDAGEITNSE